MKQIWVHKYRPKHVADVIVANERDRFKFNHYASEGEFPDLMFYGGPGTGKSSMAKALIRDCGIDKTDVIKVNCSADKIDAMRDKVTNFARTMSMGKHKVVRLEEFDNIGYDAQALLRDLIEETTSSCRWIATCNHPNKIQIEVRSRFQEYQFVAPSRDEVMLKSAEILTAENIDFDLDDLEKVVAAGYPDFRKIIHLMESNSIGGKLIIDGGGAAHDWKLELLPLLEKSDLRAARKLVCESATQNELISVYRFLYDNIHRCKKIKDQDQAIVQIAQYQYQHGFVYDGELQIAALMIELAALT